MRLNFFTEARFIKGKDDKVYSPNDVLRYTLLKGYLSVFSEINVIARVQVDPNFVGSEKDLVEGEGVLVSPISYYVGPTGFLKKRKEIYSQISTCIRSGDAYILKIPGQIGTVAAELLKKNKIEYGVEVVGDPYEVFSKNGVKHPLRLLFRYYAYYKLKRIVKDARSALYVTKKKLQEKYPNKRNFSASDVEIPSETLFLRGETTFMKGNCLKIISIGSLEQMYKGADILIKAIEVLAMKGMNVHLTWVGDGRYKKDMESLALEKNINANFVGFIGERAVINELLDRSDVFVLASRTEGLPRVILEAFSRSLPVIASKVGGIPELVDEDCMIRSEDYRTLAIKLEQLIKNPRKLIELSDRNYIKCRQYTSDILMQERIAFYKTLI